MSEPINPGICAKYLLDLSKSGSVDDKDAMILRAAANIVIERVAANIVIETVKKGLDFNNPRNEFYVPIERRRELIEHDVTLNGVRASITGVNNDFASVRQLPSGLGTEFAWHTVEHVIEHSNGEFNA